jgi:hypothetical protein
MQMSRKTYILDELALVFPMMVSEDGVRTVINDFIGSPDHITGDLPSHVYMTHADHADE